LAHALEAGFQVRNEICRIFQSHMQAKHWSFCLPGNGRAQLFRKGRNGETFIAAPRIAQAEVLQAVQQCGDAVARCRPKLYPKEPAGALEVPLPDGVPRVVRKAGMKYPGDLWPFGQPLCNLKSVPLMLVETNP